MKETYQITHLTYPSQQLELEGIIMKPEGDGPFPGAVFVHGFNRSGAWEYVWVGRELVKRGFAVFMPSQMGFGGSKGEKDYCGPKTVQGVVDGIAEFVKESFVDKTKVGIWGISRGCNVSSMIVSKYPGVVRCAVLQSGMYDFNNILETTEVLDMAENMRKESGGTEDGYKERSAINFAEGVSCPVLVLHGRQDKTYVIGQALTYTEKLKELNKNVEIKIFEDRGHDIRVYESIDIICDFFRKNF